MKKTKLFTTLGIGLLFLGAVACLSLKNDFKAAPAYAAGETRTIYLNAGGSSLWDQAGAVFYGHFWGNGDEDVKFADADGDGVYEATVTSNPTDVIFTRCEPKSTGVWDKEWNRIQTKVPTDKNCFTITGWGSSDGVWSTYTPPTTPVIHDFYLIGSFNGWATADDEYKFIYDDTAEQYVLQTSLTYGDTLKVNEGHWNGLILGHAQFVVEGSDVEISNDKDDNVVIQTKGTHTYTITLPANVIGSKTATITISEDAETAVSNFVDAYMHMSDVETSDQGTGLCKTEGWYDNAKAAYNNLTHSQKELFATDATYANAWARFQAWANANGDVIDSTTLEANPVSLSFATDNAYIIFVGILVVTILLSSGFIFVKKVRRQN